MPWNSLLAFLKSKFSNKQRPSHVAAAVAELPAEPPATFSIGQNDPLIASIWNKLLGKDEHVVLINYAKLLAPKMPPEQINSFIHVAIGELIDDYLQTVGANDPDQRNLRKKKLQSELEEEAMEKLKMTDPSTITSQTRGIMQRFSKQWQEVSGQPHAAPPLRGM